jgi:hypothetical protein
MGPKRVSISLLSALLLACAGPALADEYRAGEFLSLDLSQAVLSPKRLGPPAEFAPVAVEARSDAAQIREEPSVDYRAGVVRTTKVKPARSEPTVDDTPAVRATKKVRHAHIEKPHVPARAKVVRRHTSPLDAQAMDTRIQKWPCKSGGICAWKR